MILILKVIQGSFDLPFSTEEFYCYLTSHLEIKRVTLNIKKNALLRFGLVVLNSA